MNEITYTHHGSNEPSKVYLDKKPIGEIRNVDGGWQYFPKGQKVGGEIFGSLFLCMDSLESD